jgi:hypothetical protein
MFDLKYASINLRKAASLEGIRSDRGNAWYKPVTDNEGGVKAVVGDNKHPDGINITVFDIEYAAQHSWDDLKRAS